VAKWCLLEYTGAIGDIVRIDNQRVVTVKANVDETKIPGPVARAQAEKLLKDLPLPPGYTVEFTGEMQEQTGQGIYRCPVSDLFRSGEPV
jgi:multidrug efflux pump subunit AcrB